jgi:hypothetical protein
VSWILIPGIFVLREGTRSMSSLATRRPQLDRKAQSELPVAMAKRVTTHTFQHSFATQGRSASRPTAEQER